MKDSNYQPSILSDWTGRKTNTLDYIYQVVRCIHADSLESIEETNRFGILGYACDDGVRRNQGRVGAAEGPQSIRNALGKMAVRPGAHNRILDIGNIVCGNDQLELAHEKLTAVVTEMCKHSIFPILLGGGHDMVWGHYLGIKDANPAAYKLGVVNIDAHFDLRPPVPQANSGTAFHQIALHEKALGKTMNYLCLGINPASNVQSLINYANQFGSRFLYISQMRDMDRARETIKQFSQNLDGLYLTIDMDSILSAFSPGVSAPASVGLTPSQVFKILESILETKKLVSVDIAELNPRFDIDGRTAKLAAQFVYYLIGKLAKQKS